MANKPHRMTRTARSRSRKFAGRCEACGKPLCSCRAYQYTDESNGAITANAPFLCRECYETRYGVKIQVGKDKFCWMFNCHLYYIPYQPYQLNGIPYGDYPFIDTEEEAVRFANEARREEVTRYQKDIQQVMKEGYPVFLTGDFNEPSFLDWTQRAADAGIHKIKVEWPATKAFSEIGMNDSYRTIHPDEVSTPGYTWTPVPSEQEILDRLDFVLYSGCKVTDSFITGESEATSDVVVSPYPSDHRMVTSCFNF